VAKASARPQRAPEERDIFRTLQLNPVELTEKNQQRRAPEKSLLATPPKESYERLPLMARMIHCVKFGREMEGMDRPPFKGEMGQKLFENVSKEAWKMWLEHSKMLVNEYRLDLTSDQGQKVWMTECTKYFFEEGSALPPDFVPKSHGHGHGHGHGH
jgi:Fe-S cluster biosynthesis and repair protein YggX